MARLTRTAKYADLREQLANDKEESLSTQDLSSYQNRLDNVQDTLSFNPKKEEPEYTWTPFDDGNSFNQPVEPINPWKQEVQPEPVIEEVPVQEPVVETTPVQEPVVEVAPAQEPAVEVTPVQEPVVEETKHESSYFDSFMNSGIEETKQDSFNSYFEDTQENKTPVEVIKEVFEDVKDDSGEFVSLKERETYLNQTFSDVNSYNINNGQQTIDQLLDNSVEEVRHPENVQPQEPLTEEVIDNTQVWTPFKEEEVLDADVVETQNQFAEEKIDDEEFSNTVSMEISKIMDEIAATPVEETKPEIVEDIKIEEPVQEINETIEINEEVVEEKPEDVVEIKNIAEIEAEPVKDTMSSTIPFVVATEDEEVLEEDDEEDGSNTILNVILIVLIVVLVAVLGLIVFYILKTKGIF